MQSVSKDRDRDTRPLVAYGILLALAIASFVLVGFFTRMMADDYCTAATGISMDPFAATGYWYQNWSGNFATFFVLNAVAPTQPTFHLFLVLVFVVLWAGPLILLAYNLLALLKIEQSPLTVVLVSLLLLFSGLNLSPTVQSIFWLSAWTQHTLVIVLQTLVVAGVIWLLRAPRTRRQQILAALGLCVLAFFVSGFSVIQGTLLITAFTVLLAALWLRPSQRSNVMFLLPVLLVAGVSLIIVASAPGNQERVNALIELGVPLEGRSLVDIIRLTLEMTLNFVVLQVPTLISAAYTLLVVYLGLNALYRRDHVGLAALWFPPRPRLFIAAALGATVLLTFSVTGPTVYATNVISLRGLLVQQMTFMAFFGLLGYLLAVGNARQPVAARHGFLRKRVRVLAVSLVLVMPLAAVALNLGMRLPVAVESARQWDERHATLQAAVAAGQTTIVLEPLQPAFEHTIGIESLADADWIRGCAASYYGLERITVSGSAATP